MPTTQHRVDVSRSRIRAFLDPDRKTLDPKVDVTFKMLFAAESNRGVLIKLLTAILEPSSPIASVKVLNPDVERSSWDDKGAILDILA